MNDATELLRATEPDDGRGADELFPLVYAELRRLAGHKIAHERPGQTLEPTALVHEAYLRLAGASRARQWHSAGQFFRAAAEAMRQILVDRARRKRSRKRGGDRARVGFDDDRFAAPDEGEVLAVDEALAGLAAADPQAAELVKLRYFAGLSVSEAARALGIGARSADRLWAYARAWLRAAIGDP